MDEEAAKAERDVENWACSLWRAGMSWSLALARDAAGGLGGGVGELGITVLSPEERAEWWALARLE